MRRFSYKRWSIEWHTELSSTMDRARELVETDSRSYVAVVADYQSAGRGTGGRSWIAPPGSCLMFTTSAPVDIMPEHLQLLPVIVAGAVSKTVLEVCHVKSSVKSPNDIVTKNGKLCGILCTSRVHKGHVDWVNCGIGLNTFMSRQQLPTEFSTSLALESEFVPDHRTLLQNLLDSIESMYAELPLLLNSSGLQHSC